MHGLFHLEVVLISAEAYIEARDRGMSHEEAMANLPLYVPYYINRVPLAIYCAVLINRLCAPEQKWTAERCVSGVLWRCKSSPPPELGLVSCCLDGTAYGTPEGCLRWRSMDGCGGRFW